MLADDWRAARAKWIADAATLTDAEIALIREFDGPNEERRARKDRYKALQVPLLTPEQEAQREMDAQSVVRQSVPRVTARKAATDPAKSIANLSPERKAHYRKVIQDLRNRNVAYDTRLFTEGHQRFLEDPKSVRDSDIEQFAVVNEQFAYRALCKRDGLHDGWEASDPVVRVSDFLRWEMDCHGPITSTHVYRIRELLQRVEKLETRGMGAGMSTKASDPNGMSVEGRLAVLEAREAQAHQRLEVLEAHQN